MTGIVPVLAALLLVLVAASSQDSSGSGTLTIDGAAVSLTHAIKTTRKNPFNDFFSDPVVVLSDKPVTQQEADSEDALLARAQRGDLTLVAVRFDGRPKRGQLFNVGVAHTGLKEIALLPDVWFKYTFKGGAGTAAMPARELAGRKYGVDVKFSIPMPAEVTDEPTAAASRPLPGPSKTTADRVKASQLLIDTIQEGDEDRAVQVAALGIDPNARDAKMGIALINWAVLMCQPKVVSALVELKADLSHERIPGMSLLTEARAACPEAVGYLKAGGAK